MIPLKDDIPTRTFPFVTIALIAVNVAVFFYELSLGPRAERFLFAYGAIPYNLTHPVRAASAQAPVFLSLFTSMFLHGGFLHVGGNMLYLWIFGNNIEDVTGHFRFIVFYLVCGVAAAYSHALFDAHSRVPMIGASGAIAGVLGAYILLFPHAKVLTLVPLGFFIQLMRIPAIFVLGFWILFQFLNGFLGVREAEGGVAWFAHIGGFLTGMALIFFFKKKKAGRSAWG